MLFLPSPLTSSLPQLMHTLSLPRETEKGRQSLVRREKSISLRVMQKERESLSRGGVWPLLMWHITSTYIFSTQFSVQIKSAQPCTSVWNPLGKGSCPADEIRKDRDTPFHTNPQPVKPLWLLLISPHLNCHSCFFTQSLPLILSLRLTMAKSLILALELCSSKIKFCPLILEILKQLCQKPHGNHVCIYFSIWRNFSYYLLNRKILSKYYIKTNQNNPLPLQNPQKTPSQ